MPTSDGTPDGAVPVLDRPAACRSDRREAGIGVDRVGPPHRREQRHVEDAVRTGVAPAEVDALGVRPPPHGLELAQAPHEPVLQPAGVATGAHFVAGGDDVVETHLLCERRDHVDRCRRREHEPIARAPELGQQPGRERCHQGGQVGHRSLSRLAHLVHGPALRDTCGGACQAHRRAGSPRTDRRSGRGGGPPEGSARPARRRRRPRRRSGPGRSPGGATSGRGRRKPPSRQWRLLGAAACGHWE